MPSVKFRKEDFQGKTPMQPTWYTVVATEFTEKPSKDGDSTNFWGDFEVTQDGTFQGTKIAHCFSEKALQYAGGAADYMACFTTDTEKLVDAEVLDVLKMTVGKPVQGYIEWNPDFRRNQFKDWRAAR